VNKYVVIVKKIKVYEVEVEAHTREEARDRAAVGDKKPFNEYTKIGRPQTLQVEE
jgi:hypothetical protein